MLYSLQSHSCKKKKKKKSQQSLSLDEATMKVIVLLWVGFKVTSDTSDNIFTKTFINYSDIVDICA